MRYSLLSAALFAASSVAAPIDVRKVVYDVTVVTCTDVITVVGPSPTATPAAGGQYIQEPYTPPVVEAPAPTSAPAYTPPAPAYTPPAPVSTPAAVVAPPTSYNDGSPMSGDKSVLSIINKYRSKYNMKPLEWSSQLANNAGKTTNDNHGVTEKHELNHGSMGQCLTPGFSQPTSKFDTKGTTPFELAYLSWMCESAGDSQLQPAQNDGVNVCALVTGGKSIMHMNLSGEKGHYEILTSHSYSKIGCAFTENPNAEQPMWTGLWGCDLA